MGRKLIYLDDAIGAADRADYTGLAVEDVKKVTDEVVKELKKLPSAQPEPSQVARDIATIIENEKDMRVIAQPQRWIPVTERMPEKDHWLGGSGRQFSDEVLVSVTNYDDEDIWTDISQTIDGEWALELPSNCKIIAWMPLPEPYGGDNE